MPKKPKSNIPFKCPHNTFSCPHIDSVNMKATKSCKECEFNKK